MLLMVTQYNALMQVTILTLFPEYFISPLKTSMVGRAGRSGSVNFKIINIRDFATDKQRTTDDRPFGGGPGMVMKVEPIDLALKTIDTKEIKSKTILTSAKGELFDQKKAQEYAALDNLTIICGHYEGVDERVAEHLVDEEIRVGDFVLTGGEAAAGVILDAVVRLLPDVLGNPESLSGESHNKPGILGFPQFTRPENYNDWKVPEVLLSGNHKQIEEWREKNRQKQLPKSPSSG